MSGCVPAAHRMPLVQLAAVLALLIASAEPAGARSAAVPPGAAASPATSPAAGALPDEAPDEAPGQEKDSDTPLDQAALAAAIGTEKAARTEAVIRHLHGKLKITPAQETAWETFTGIMRRNAVRMDRAAMKPGQPDGTLSAVQSLSAYGAFEQTSASNFARLLPPFQRLYDQFSPSQKLTADRTFFRYFSMAMTDTH